MQENLRLRVPALEWSVLEGKGELRGLSWVNSSIDMDAEPFSVQEHGVYENISIPDSSFPLRDMRQVHGFRGELQVMGHVQFKHRSYEKYLPKIMTLSAQNAQMRGEPTVLEGMQLLYARVEWLMKSRPYFWSSLSPVKDLMAILAESYGISPALHNSNRDVLARVLSRMPSYYPKRGNVKNALMLWKDTLERSLDVEIAHLDTHGAFPSNPDITDEVFICHRSEWWIRRLPKGVHQRVKEEYRKKFRSTSTTTLEKSAQESDATSISSRKESSMVSYPMGMRIEGGVLRFQLSEEHHQVPLIKEDIIVQVSNNKQVPSELFQLLPNWTSVRFILKNDESSSI